MCKFPLGRCSNWDLITEHKFKPRFKEFWIKPEGRPPIPGAKVPVQSNM